MPSRLERKLRLPALLAGFAAALLAFWPGSAPADEAAHPRIAVVIAEAVGVGPLADRLGDIAVEHLRNRAAVVDPAEASRTLRQLGGPDPLTCGSEIGCLHEVARLLGVERLLAIGIGRFTGMYALELQLVEAGSGEKPRRVSSTWAEPGPDWQAAVPRAIDELLPAPATGTLLVRAAEPGELRIDGAPAGTLPMARPVVLPIGTHRVELRAGERRSEATVTVEPGRQAEVELALAPALVAIGAAPPRWQRTAAWIAGGTAVAVLAAAIATHASAASTMDDARGRKDAGKPFASVREDALAQIRTARWLYGGAAVLAAGATTLWFLDPGDPQAEPAAQR